MRGWLRHTLPRSGAAGSAGGAARSSDSRSSHRCGARGVARPALRDPRSAGTEARGLLLGSPSAALIQ